MSQWLKERGISLLDNALYEWKRELSNRFTRSDMGFIAVSNNSLCSGSC